MPREWARCVSARVVVVKREVVTEFFHQTVRVIAADIESQR